MAAAAAASTAAGTGYKLLLSCPEGLPRSRVSVRFDPSFDRTPHPDASLEESICEVVCLTPIVSALAPCQYGGHALHHSDESSQEYCVSLHLGLTDYRTFVGTNMSPLWEKFLVSSEDDSVCCQHMSNPLGNGAIVETSDEKIILLQRSNNVGESPGHYVFPGGHSEPQEAGILAHQNDEKDVAGLIDRISDEMFDGIIREVVEETGVPASSLTEPILIGVSQRETNVRPAAFFYMRCNIDSGAITELYARAQDGYESTKLCAVSPKELREMSQRLPGCHLGGFALYQLMRNAWKSS
ncbi:nudix hydrolase 9 isoform X2 [Hordeum vulgare subsp. vulgare]|uniref:nudix hydrolase 9 isoform X2 n=1 Tax=Hordeum vulgare subsp. vulgare TaxID=112509 RepID=UPI001D1A4F1D|nr:nudix hydrolase 9 isoform X2 [Hordeum vulgare subsp. vulgare]